MTATQPVDGVTADQAVLLLDQGLSVFPVPLPRTGVASGSPGDGKVPASGFSWQPWQQTRPTEAQVRTWFAQPQNVAVVTGAISDLVVIDADNAEAKAWAVRHLPRTPRQVLTPRGSHFYYRHPGVPVRNRARIRTDAGQLALDVRADGGYVIGPFSVHASGERYWPLVNCIDPHGWDAPLSEVPIFDSAWLAPPPVEPPVRRARPVGAVADRVQRYLAAVPRPDIGAGSDHAVFQIACKLTRGFGLSAEETVDHIEAWAGGRPGWDRRWIAAKVAHAERYGTEPVGGLL